MLMPLGKQSPLGLGWSLFLHRSSISADLEVEEKPPTTMTRFEAFSPCCNSSLPHMFGNTYDVRRHVDIPYFQEAEVDAYFSVFERLRWPKEM